MPETLIHPPRTILEVWETLPEGTLCQIINDKLIMSPAPITVHQIVSGAIYVEIALHLKKANLGKVFIAPYDVHFSKRNILQPDILFVRNENLNKIKANGLFGAPDIVIEILSPSTSHYDLQEKKLVYERHGVQEYFIVDPNSKKVNSFFLNNGEYEEQQSENERIKSKTLSDVFLF